MKKLLIDLSNYGAITNGFGQIAKNYAHYFVKAKKQGRLDCELLFLLPPKCDDIQLLQSEYVTCVQPNKTIGRWLGINLPKVDVWHSVNQQQRMRRITSNTKFIFTIHDFNFLTEKSPSKAAMYLARMQHRVDQASVVTAISEYTANVVRQHVNLRGKDVQVIYNGVEDLTHLPATAPAFATGRKFFFAMGQCRRKKNFHLLLDVMKSFPEYDLYICGQPSRLDYVEEIKSHIEAEHITNAKYVGRVTEDERVWLFKNCSAYLFPSIGEGFGLPMIEAMQFGKPVFISKATCLPEISAGHAFVWEDLNTDAMVSVIKQNLDRFYADNAMQQAAIKHASNFSYDKHINSYIEIYNRLLADNYK